MNFLVKMFVSIICTHDGVYLTPWFKVDFVVVVVAAVVAVALWQLRPTRSALTQRGWEHDFLTSSFHFQPSAFESSIGNFRHLLKEMYHHIVFLVLIFFRLIKVKTRCVFSFKEWIYFWSARRMIIFWWDENVPIKKKEMKIVQKKTKTLEADFYIFLSRFAFDFYALGRRYENKLPQKIEL